VESPAGHNEGHNCSMKNDPSRICMGTSTVVDVARRALGPVGALLPVSFTDPLSIDRQREAVGRLERAGYRAAWTNEVIGGKDALEQLAVPLPATERMVFGTSVANVRARQPQTAHGAAVLLAQAYPDRFVLGLGVGYPQRAASTGRAIAGTVREHRTAGADHVILMLQPGGDFADGVDQLERLAAALGET
jgi:Luciferase-like monooxygenase